MSQSNIQNHVAIVLDNSGSMSHIISDAQTVVENVITHLKNKSITFDQETRISFYVFNSNTECVIYNMDAMRFKSLSRIRVTGMTALMDAVGIALDDLQKIPQLYCNHAFMVYVITDGHENGSRNYNVNQFRQKISNLPDNFTLVGYAPNNMSKDHLISLGFHKGNVDKWDTTQQGLVELETSISRTVDTYFTLRSQGKSSSNAIMSDLSQVKKTQVTRNLQALSTKQYSIVHN